jgi:hypothetical protein
MSKSYDFEIEAERLWQIEKMSDTLVTISGLVLLSASTGLHSRGEESRKYMNEMTQMAMRMKLFGVKDTLTTNDVADFSTQHQIQLSYAAWGPFNTLG